MMFDSLYGSFRTRTFAEIFPTMEEFVAFYNNNPIPSSLSTGTIQIVYGLLYGRYGNSSIASSDENRFKVALCSTIYTYGPNWWAKHQIQEKLRNLTDEEILSGGIEIYNHADHPGGSISTATDGIINAVNAQNTSKRKRGKVDAYMRLYEILHSDDTERFLNYFAKLFLRIVQPEEPLLYGSEPENFWWT